MINASHHDLRHAAGAGIFCNLYCRVVAIDRRDLRAKLLCQTEILPQTLCIFSANLFDLRRLDQKRREAAVKRLRHAGRSSNHLGIGGGRRETD